jgi:signal transduction histidine kinase
LAVTDACGGIPEADLPRVFDVAFRGESARTPESPREGDGGGGGLGLAIVRGLVEAHRGDVAVSNVGDGCRFVVRLPALA